MMKSFAFLAVTLMLLVAVAPTISSVKVSNADIIKQQSQDLIYKAYYPGAPRDNPKVTYYYPDRVMVLFKDFIDVSKIEEIEVDGNYYTITDRIPEANVGILEATRSDLIEFIEEVEKNDIVECASLDDIRYLCDGPDDPYYQNGSQWGIKAINCNKAWAVPRKMDLTWLTIIDSGIDSDHEDLKSANIYQWDFLENDGTADDDTDEGHGTKVAGVAMARMNNGKGIAGVAGDAPNLEILKIFPNSGESWVSYVILALTHCTSLHKAPSAILMSFGGKGNSSVEEAICLKISSRDESLLISSVGNGGDDSGVYYPAGYQSVIGVGAVNINLELCIYPGNWGSNYNNDKRQVDLVAPGDNIITTTDPDKVGEKYEFWVGKTSAAAAFVAGVAMLWYGARAEQKNYILRKNELSLCRHVLYSNAIPLGEESPPNNKYGWGLVDAYASMPLTRTSREKPQIDFIKCLIGNFPLLDNLLYNFFSKAFPDKNFEKRVGVLIK